MDSGGLLRVQERENHGVSRPHARSFVGLRRQTQTALTETASGSGEQVNWVGAAGAVCAVNRERLPWEH